MNYLCLQQFNPKSLSLAPSLGKSDMLGPQQIPFQTWPFKAVRGEHFDFSRPRFNKMRVELIGVQQLLASPEDWIARLQ
jgi:hypothetical protein